MKSKSLKNSDIKIGVIGLGYVGLPLAVEFGRYYSVVGFDIDHRRVEELRNGIDKTLEVNSGGLARALFLKFSSSVSDLNECNYYIVSVPTPVNDHKIPDLKPLLSACETVGSVLSAGDIVIFESTVYPGATEEDCVPVLEKHSGLKFNRDFFCGYSPERINPGDKKHTLVNIKKITSGSTLKTSVMVDSLYKSIITAGTHRAPSIRVAEAAKVIENSQRDINIAFMNELSKIFNKLNIDTGEVLAAAETKWNFLPFKPGLVGGHCIGVDPYYLTYKAQSLGYIPEIILAGRRLNDNMGGYVANQIIKLMIKKNILINKSKALILGVTFKENCPDIRNSRVIDIISELREFGVTVEVFDPGADAAEVYYEYGIKLISKIENKKYDAIVLAVAHEIFKNVDFNILRKKNSIIYDVKGMLKIKVDGRL